MAHVAANISSVYDLIAPLDLTSGHWVERLRYNSQCINFSEWITLFTLCLAPLIAHIFSGAPPAVCLTRKRPKWHDYLCQYNPTSILWRYAAITDRRLRALRWTTDDLAASNAIFWTSRGWDGGEHMVRAASLYCSKLPSKTHVELASVTMLKTIIVVLQGTSAMHSLIGALAGRKDINFVALMGVDLVFYPLAVFGLVRLCAAYWLTEDFIYAFREDGQLNATANMPVNKEDNIPLIERSDVYDPWLANPLPVNSRFTSPAASWPSRIFRLLFFVWTAGIWAISLVFLMPFPARVTLYTTTSLLVGILYFSFFLISTMIYGYYFFRGETTSTTIPSMNKTWYKAYSLLLISFMVIVVIIASIETNRGPNGMYSSARPPMHLTCHARSTWWFSSENFGFRGLFSTKQEELTRDGHVFAGAPMRNSLTSSSTTQNQMYWQYNFTGYCVGQLDD